MLQGQHAQLNLLKLLCELMQGVSDLSNLVSHPERLALLDSLISKASEQLDGDIGASVSAQQIAYILDSLHSTAALEQVKLCKVNGCTYCRCFKHFCTAYLKVNALVQPFHLQWCTVQ